MGIIRYYEATFPHYFLIKATDENKALTQYLSVLDYIDDDDRECCQGVRDRIKEVEKEYAYMQFVFNSDLSGVTTTSEVDELLRKFFNNEDNTILLISTKN